MKTCVTNGLLSRVGAALPMKAKPDIKNAIHPVIRTNSVKFYSRCHPTCRIRPLLQPKLLSSVTG